MYLIVGQRALIGGGEPFLPHPLLVVFFAGAHGVLWFLPMLLACAVLTDLLVRGSRSRRFLIVVCVVATVAVYLVGTSDFPRPRQLRTRAALALVYLGGMEIRAHAQRGFLATAAAVVGIAALVSVGAARVVDGASVSAAASSVETVLWVVGSLAILLATIDGTRWWGVERLEWDATTSSGSTSRTCSGWGPSSRSSRTPGRRGCGFWSAGSSVSPAPP